MTQNIDPALRAWLDLREMFDEWTDVDDRAPVIVRLRDGGGLLELRRTVPSSRAECPTRRSAVTGHVLCGHVCCRDHLWRVDAGDRPGRRHAESPITTTLRAAWLESPVPACCALDLAERGGMEATAIAREMDCHPSLVRWIVRRAAPKLKVNY